MARAVPQGKRLDTAMTKAGVSRSELARRLAARDDATATQRSLYRNLKKWIAGTQPITLPNQVALEDELSLPVGYLFEADVTAARQRELERRVDVVENELLELRALLVEIRAALP